MNLQKNIRRVLREEYIPTETEYLGWDIPRKLYDELEDIGIKRWDKENDKVYIAEFQFDTKSVVFEILDSTGEAYFNSLFPIPLSYKSYHTKKIKDLPISIKYFIRRRFEQEWVNIMDKYDDDGKIIQESIRRVLREEDYSPAGKEIIPNSIIVHKSNPMFRDKIMENGLKVRAGECYKIFVGYGVKCKPAIFATNSTNKRAWFDSTYDDDIWFIDTRMIPDVKWYKDRHFESTKKHIVTFQDIPKEAITLHYEGTGSGDVKKWDKDSPNLYEAIRRILRESIDKSEDKKLELVTKMIHEFFDEVSFIQIKKYENKRMIIVYFDNDETAGNEETYFAEQIQDKIYEYTGIKLIPYWHTIQYNTDADFRLDAIKLKYDSEGNVINEAIRRILKEDAEIKSNYQKVIDNFKKILPERYSEKIDEVFIYIKDFIDKEGFQIKVLNNCQVIFKGVRTKNFIVICSPESYTSLAELVYIIFHEIRHEIQMGKLGQINPLSGDLEDFDELYKMYWEMEMDAHEYAIDWVNKIGNIINLPKGYYKLSPMVTEYPTMSHMVREQIVSINEMIKELKQKGYDYNDMSDLPFVKKHLDKLEELF